LSANSRLLLAWTATSRCWRSNWNFGHALGVIYLTRIAGPRHHHTTSIMDIFSSLNLNTIALLLDVDGTLIDIGPSPNEVHVSTELRASLSRLVQRTGGAVALVSGRLITDLDQMFAPLKLPAIGAHGAQMRAAGREVEQLVRSLPDNLRLGLASAVISAVISGVIFEDKGYSVALHYRSVPHQESRLLELLHAACAKFPDQSLEILHGKATLEIKRGGVSKGSAVRVLMRTAPFSGRTPVFVGDDVTDETVFAVLPELGGRGFSVGRRFGGTAGLFDTPMQVRGALQALAANGGAQA
jgi:trehalose 6-phosphate phosphatase